jgi:hypothetical protein
VLRCMVLLNRKKTPAAREQDVTTYDGMPQGWPAEKQEGTARECLSPVRADRR